MLQCVHYKQNKGIADFLYTLCDLHYYAIGRTGYEKPFGTAEVIDFSGFDRKRKMVVLDSLLDSFKKAGKLIECSRIDKPFDCSVTIDMR